MKKLLIIFLIASALSAQKFEKLALTPPMGWNSWNKFGCNINEEIIKKMADAMVSSGMKDAGYQYIIIDDCWQGQRDSLGFIQPDPERFPSGMKALADYIHSKGLKFGIYSDAGWNTCGGRPGSRGYEFQDAKKYAEWGVDYLKYDWCYTEGLCAEGAYLTMRNALYAAKRPIVFSICEWGNNKPWLWAKNIGHLWRTTGDITACFDCVVDHGSWKSWGIMQILDMQNGLRAYAGPDHWNDPDMLEVGNGMSVNEDRAHFSMWCMLAAPLIAGNDLSNMTDETREILTNKEVIAVNQDSLGIQGFKYFEKDGLEIWFKPLKNNNWAVCFLNRSTKPIEINFQWNNHVVIDSLFNKEANFKTSIYQIRDLWLKKEVGTTEKNFYAVLPSHDVIMLRLKPIKK
ncbi:MAG: glycoside hydrolase family 27 protein [Melioribacteraceae bacterium]